MSTPSANSASTVWKRFLGVLGPFFGLGLVLGIFIGLLLVKDVADQVEKDQLHGWSGWQQAWQASSLDGFRAFISVANIKTVLAQTVIVAIGALGMTLIIVSGGIDLSVGSAVALTSVLGATLLNRGCGAGAAMA